MDIGVLSDQPAIATAFVAAASLMALVYRRPRPSDTIQVLRRSWQTRAAAVCLERAAELAAEPPEAEGVRTPALDLTEAPATIDLAEPAVDLRHPERRDSMLE